ncbi:unnamed protein product, partial [Trichogramma brassicae]
MLSERVGVDEWPVSIVLHTCVEINRCKQVELSSRSGCRSRLDELVLVVGRNLDKNHTRGLMQRACRDDSRGARCTVKRIARGRRELRIACSSAAGMRRHAISVPNDKACAARHFT